MNVPDYNYVAVILSPNNETTVVTVLTLVMSSVGIGLSAVALILLILTALLFAEWRQSYKNQLLIQFITARFFYVLFRYFNNVRDVFGLYEMDEDAKGLKHKLLVLFYTEIAFVFWMLVFTQQLYRSMVKIFEVHKNHLVRNSILAWGLPIIVASSMVFAVTYFKDAYLTIHLIYFFVLKWPILLVNAILLCKSYRSILKTNTRAKNNRRIAFVMIAMIFSFCFQQCFMDLYKILYVTLLSKKIKVHFTVNGLYVFFNIFALYQCAVSTIFWVFGNANTRQMWRFIPKSQRVISQISMQNLRISTKL